jgi:NADH:ubiquinone oxidoreductase subunit E
VATFYTMFNKQRVGKYFIQLCGTTPCMVCGAEEIKSTIEKTLGIHDGGAYQTTGVTTPVSYIPLMLQWW